jgi:hypothetical protein
MKKRPAGVDYNMFHHSLAKKWTRKPLRVAYHLLIIGGLAGQKYDACCMLAAYLLCKGTLSAKVDFLANKRPYLTLLGPCIAGWIDSWLVWADGQNCYTLY